MNNYNSQLRTTDHSCAVHLTLAKRTTPVKREVIEKNSQGASDGRCQRVFVFKYCMSRGQCLSGNVAGGRIGAPLLVVLLLRYDCVLFKTEKSLHTISILCLRVLFQLLVCGLNP